MISIQRYLRQRVGASSESGGSLTDVIRLLIESIECQAVEGAPEEIGLFQQSTQEVLAALDSNAPQDELLSRAASAMEAMQRYHQHMVEYIRHPAVELQEKVKSLTATITAIGGTSCDSIGRLRQIKGRILASLSLKEIRDLRQLLSECLDGVMLEAEQHRTETSRAVELLNRKQPRAANCVGEQATSAGGGLPARAFAEEAIAEACQDEDPAFVVVIVINQLQVANANFGPEFGEQMVQRYTAFLSQQLTAVDRLYRWSGSALVALIRRTKSLEAVRLELAHPLTQRVAMRVSGSEVQLPISARWTVLPLMASPRLLFRKLDGFADFR